jgi:hypothetical protein
VSDLSRDPFEVAKAKGPVCVLPEDDVLQVDLDDEGDMPHLEEMLRVALGNGIHFEVVKVTRSAGGNQHVYIRSLSFPVRDPTLRVALQACFGSDRKRELLSAFRVLQGCELPTVFFEVPEK